MGLVTLILSVFVGEARLEQEVYPQFLAALRAAFPMLAALCFVGTLASLARGNVRRSVA